MNEIGSEFWNIPMCEKKNELFPLDTRWFLSGRIALKAIIQDIKSKYQVSTVALPSWCCDSQIIPFIEAGINASFYESLKPITQVDADILMVMDYFGYASNNTGFSFDGIVIRDITHSVFSREYKDADYYFGSLRKWAGFWTGGFAWGFTGPIEYKDNDLGYAALRANAMQQKEDYICKKNICDDETAEDKRYLSKFGEAEDLLDKIDILPASSRDIGCAEYLDPEAIKKQRRKNARILLDAFYEMAVFPELGTDDCPLFVPICVPNRDALRKHLISNKIYCPVHWPLTPYHRISDPCKIIYGSELSLVCDQRYSEEDMKRIVKTVQQFFEES